MPERVAADPLAAKRVALREEFFGRMFVLGGWLGGTDTYKRTMWAAVPDIAVAPAGYGLTMRKGLPEPGAGNQLIMAGHEAMLAQWFHRPLRRRDIELARRWYADHSAVRAFPHHLWDTILQSQPGEDIYLPVDIWGFPIGHDMMSAAQSVERPLGEAEYEMMDRFVTAFGQAALLCDLVDAESVGLENALRVMKAHPETDRVGVRVDSGDIAAQCVLYFKKMKEAGISPRTIVFEDEVTPDSVRKVYAHFRSTTGEEPTMLFPGAGGYWWRLVHRDTLSAAFKRTATEDRPNVKFSNSPGKETLGGYLRVYARDDTLIVVDASELPLGEPAFVTVVAPAR